MTGNAIGIYNYHSWWWPTVQVYRRVREQVLSFSLMFGSEARLSIDVMLACHQEKNQSHLATMLCNWDREWKQPTIMFALNCPCNNVDKRLWLESGRCSLLCWWPSLASFHMWTCGIFEWGLCHDLDCWYCLVTLLALSCDLVCPCLMTLTVRLLSHELDLCSLCS